MTKIWNAIFVPATNYSLESDYTQFNFQSFIQTWNIGTNHTRLQPLKKVSIEKQPLQLFLSGALVEHSLAGTHLSFMICGSLKVKLWKRCVLRNPRTPRKTQALKSLRHAMLRYRWCNRLCCQSRIEETLTLDVPWSRGRSTVMVAQFTVEEHVLALTTRAFYPCFCSRAFQFQKI